MYILHDTNRTTHVKADLAKSCPWLHNSENKLHKVTMCHKKAFNECLVSDKRQTCSSYLSLRLMLVELFKTIFWGTGIAILHQIFSAERNTWKMYQYVKHTLLWWIARYERVSQVCITTTFSHPKTTLNFPQIPIRKYLLICFTIPATVIIYFHVGIH